MPFRTFADLMRPLILSMAMASSLLIAACGGGDGGDALLDPDNPGGSAATSLEVLGPNQADSGTVKVEAGTITDGFVVTVLNNAGNPVEGAFVAIEADQGIINAPPSEANSGGDTSDSDGEVRFAYQAPDDIVTDTAIKITATVTDADSGDELTETYTLTVTAASPPVVKITGPSAVAPGVSNSGFKVAVTQASGAQVSDGCVTLSASSGTLSPTPTTTCSATGLAGYELSSTGTLSFSYTPPANVATDTSATLTASTNVASQDGSGSLTVTVAADTFQFTDPDAGAAIVVGSSNREALHFQWTRDADTPGGAAGVAGTVTLTADAPALLALGSDTSGTSSVTVSTKSSTDGDFAQSVYVFSNSAGTVTITAHDDTTDRDASLPLQFVDTPSEVNLDADPLVIESSPSSARFSDLEVTVLNQVGEPIEGVEVEFLLVTPVSTSDGEQIFPSVQVTDDEGKAYSRFEAGTAQGTATVQAKIQDSSVRSNTRTLTVEAP
jgi:hypothetical protein